MASKYIQSPTLIVGSSADGITTSIESHVGPKSLVGRRAPPEGSRGMALSTAWSNTTQLKDPYTPSLMYSATLGSPPDDEIGRLLRLQTCEDDESDVVQKDEDEVVSSSYSGALAGAPKVSMAAASQSCSAESSRLPMTDTAYVWDADTMYLPGSAMMSTPHPAGKCSSRASASTVAMSQKESMAPSVPGNPPPQSRIDSSSPCSALAMSNTLRADSTAVAKGEGSVQPLPTWNETPTTLSPSETALLRRGRHSASPAPNLELKRHTLLLSSTAIRRMRRASGKEAAILVSSAELSTVISPTLLSAA
mmetsp:Transcript_20733/g.40300  ORF Transcript_20733/g.40300 Transcript_20733/m.40300 type:complete len:307 (-) Transcript_20733:660-1580(-)